MVKSPRHKWSGFLVISGWVFSSKLSSAAPRHRGNRVCECHGRRKQRANVSGNVLAQSGALPSRIYHGERADGETGLRIAELELTVAPGTVSWARPGGETQRDVRAPSGLLLDGLASDGVLASVRAHTGIPCESGPRGWRAVTRAKCRRQTGSQQQTRNRSRPASCSHEQATPTWAVGACALQPWPEGPWCWRYATRHGSPER